MSRTMLLIATLFTALFSSTLSFNAQAKENTIQIITPVPAPKETIVAPKGYVSCFTVRAGWYKDQWYPERRICQYDHSVVTAPATGTSTTTTVTTTNSAVQGDAWVESYWVCTKYLTEERTKGQCTNWEWRPGHWVKTLSIYYIRPSIKGRTYLPFYLIQLFFSTYNN